MHKTNEYHEGSQDSSASPQQKTHLNHSSMKNLNQPNSINFNNNNDEEANSIKAIYKSVSPVRLRPERGSIEPQTTNHTSSFNINPIRVKHKIKSMVNVNFESVKDIHSRKQSSDNDNLNETTSISNNFFHNKN